MARFFINPRYREFLFREGLEKAEDFLRLSGVIYCGHPDRHVARLTLGNTLPVFLKKEHCVRWRDRLGNFLAGFGFVSKSWRELATDRMLEQANINRPELIAAGEAQGQAFLLLREVPDAVELRSFLETHGDPKMRRQLGRKLGAELARIHAAGIDHPDLLSKHVLVQPETMELCFLDWQRSRQRGQLRPSHRYRDLAALDATLADDLATDRERLVCLHSYWRAAGLIPAGMNTAARRIRASADKLLKKRYIRELRRPGLTPGKQNLIWLDGEAVCITREFQEEIKDRLAAWVDLLRLPTPPEQEIHRRLVSLPRDRVGRLVRRRQSRPWSWLWQRLRGCSWVAPEMQQAATLFRLQRNTVVGPKLLAVGQRRTKPWLTESFILTESGPSRVRLVEWLACRQGRALTRQETQQLRQVLQEAGAVLARMHETGTFLDRHCDPRTIFDLEINPPEPPQVVLSSVESLRRCRKARSGRALKDLRKLHAQFAALCSPSDVLCFVLGYCDQPRMPPAIQEWAGVGPRKHRRAVA